MTNGLTAKVNPKEVVYDIHLDGTCCSGFSNYKEGPKEAIFDTLKNFIENRSEYWSTSYYKTYSVGHKVIAAMPLVEWIDD